MDLFWIIVEEGLYSGTELQDMKLTVRNARRTEICFISDASVAKGGASFRFYYG